MDPTPEDHLLREIHLIDTLLAQQERTSCAYLVGALEPLLVDPGPSATIETVVAGLLDYGVGPKDLAHIVVTHTHVDHAGAVGYLIESFPRATVWVHEAGVRNLVDPWRPLELARRLHQPTRASELFGPMKPVPKRRIRVVRGGELLEIGGRTIEVLYTPGHASDHISLVDSMTGGIFAGEALGIYLPDVGVLRPSTPPPDADVRLAVESIERIRSCAATHLMLSHFGPITDVEGFCLLATERLRKWAEIVRRAIDDA